MLLKILGVDTPHKKGEFCRKLIRPYYTLCYFSTPFVYLRDGEFYEGEKGNILINTPNYLVYHGPRADSEEGFVNDWIHILGDDFGELLKKYPLPLNKAFSIDEHYLFHRYAKRLRSEWRLRRSIGADDMMESLITEMIITLHRAYTKTVSFNEKHEDITVVRRKIIENPTKNWTLKEMASMGGYSTSRFSELYNKQYGCSPINDVINQRILIAKELLSSGQVSVSYVAEACGFSTINYFSKYFKKATGYTPSEYIGLFEEK